MEMEREKGEKIKKKSRLDEVCVHPRELRIYRASNEAVASFSPFSSAAGPVLE